MCAGEQSNGRQGLHGLQFQVGSLKPNDKKVLFFKKEIEIAVVPAAE